MRTPVERPRRCQLCRKRLLLSKEGYRCLMCPAVLCRSCAPIHFASKNEQVMALEVLKSMLDFMMRAPKLFMQFASKPKKGHPGRGGKRTDAAKGR